MSVTDTIPCIMNHITFVPRSKQTVPLDSPGQKLCLLEVHMLRTYISNAIIGMNESKILKLELFDVLARVNTWMRRCDDASEAAGTM